MDNILREKSFQFAVKIVRLYQKIITENKEYVLSKQILKSGTSIGANVAEANGGISPSDFSSKISIAYKESLETKYWLNLLKETGYITPQAFDSLHSDCDELSRIMYGILKKTRINIK